MDDDLRRQLFDPATAHGLVLARRPPTRSAVQDVVSDLVWHEVVGLLRWSAAATGGDPELEAGRWWRLAAACADLLRRIPALIDELDEPSSTAPTIDDSDLSGTARVERAAERLARLLQTSGELPLDRLAVAVDALGAAAVSAVAEASPWAVPGSPCLIPRPPGR
jgi:hypothetical protein